MIHCRSILKRNLLNFKFSNRKQDEPQTQKIYINEQSIQKKIRQMRQNSPTEQKQKKKISAQFMPNFVLPQVNKKVNEFRRSTQSQSIFAFSDITLQQKPTQLQITGFDSQFFQIDSFFYPPSIILTPNQVLNWQVQSAQDIKMEHFSILKILQPIPHYIILGVPDSRVITQEVRQGLKNFGIKVDIIDLFQAISQYNTVVNNDKYCIAFLMTN